MSDAIKNHLFTNHTGTSVSIAVCTLIGIGCLSFTVDRIAKALFQRYFPSAAETFPRKVFSYGIGALVFSSFSSFLRAPAQEIFASFVIYPLARIIIPKIAEKLSHSAGARLDKEKKITFKDIAGNPEAKKAMQTFVEFVESLNSPNPLHKKLGVRMPAGILFSGPPGTGKTLFAKALAGETGCPFVSMKASELDRIYVGTGTLGVEDHFEDARWLAKNAKKPCILFIDEVDAIGAKRIQTHLTPYKTDTLTAILTRLGSPEFSNIFVIMATNRRSVLDNALIRSGRIDREIVFKLPTEEERLAILQVHAKKYMVDQLNKDQILLSMAQNTENFSGADLSTLINGAALITLQRVDPSDKEIFISQSDFDEALKIMKEKNPVHVDEDSEDEPFAPHPPSSQPLLTLEDVAKLFAAMVSASGIRFQPASSTTL